jgi:hypothetical protein
MKNEDYLELARECGAHEVSGFGQYVAMIGEYCFTQTELLAYTREIERRVLEKAAFHFIDQMDGSDVKDDQLNKFLWNVSQQLRAMIKEKE